MHSINETTKLLNLYKTLFPDSVFDTDSLAQFLVFESAAGLLDKNDKSLINLVGSISTIAADLQTKPLTDYVLCAYFDTYGECFKAGMYSAGAPLIERVAFGNVAPLAEVLGYVAKEIQEQRG